MHHFGDAEYGAMPSAGKMKKARQPSRFSFSGLCLALWVPWFLFMLMYAVMSFSMHHNEKTLCFFCAFLGFIFVLLSAKLAYDSATKQHGEGHTDPSWFVFLSIACFIAWICGVLLGDLNYFYNMEPYYEVKTLNTYPEVDPAEMPGQMLMDAGRITFVNGSRPDVRKAMAFKNLDVYCVAPIVNEWTRKKNTSITYDFWAVGLNCCSGTPGDFNCGEHSNKEASSGLRVMRDDQREFYRLAVKQAEAAYDLKAKHPLFFYWMEDPGAEIAAYMDEGFKYYMFGLVTFFAFMLFFVIVAAAFFAKMS